MPNLQFNVRDELYIWHKRDLTDEQRSALYEKLRSDVEEEKAMWDKTHNNKQ